jgi:sporulation integral membrane protein YlbJ
MIFLFIFLLFQNTKEVLISVRMGIDIWKNNIFPSLFPFFIISHIMIDFGFIELFKELFRPIMNHLKLNVNASFILAMSLLSGSPSNAKYTKELYKKGLLKKEEAEKVLTFTYFSSPLFILGTLGIVYLQNEKVAIWILIIHVLSNFIVAYLFKNYYISPPSNEKMNIKNSISNMIEIQKQKKISVSIVHSIQESLSTMVLILGSVVFIFIVTSSLSTFFPSNPYLASTIKGILEVTQGLQATSILDIPMRYKGTLSIMLLSFGGISIYIQIISILSDTDIRTFPYLIARIFHAAIAGSIFYIVYPLI